MKKFLKIILSIIIASAVLFFGFIALVLTALSTGNDYYALLVVFWILATSITVLIHLWNKRYNKTIWKGFGIALALTIISVSGIEIREGYIESIPTVTEIPLSVYNPFYNDTKAVTLEEESTLRLYESLPRVDGATALYPIYSSFVRNAYSWEAFEKNDDVISCSTTPGAYEKLINGEADIIFAAAPSKQQLEAAENANIEFKLTPIGRESFVFFVNSKNPVKSLSIEEIRDIYSGKITNWKQVGGKNQKIKSFQREEGSGSQTAMLKFMGDTPISEPLIEERVSAMGGMIKNVADYKNYKNSIGYTFLFYATEMVKADEIKLLSLNGIEPTRENASNGTYPYTSDFYAITAGSKNSNIDIFIEWIKSEQGQYIVEKTGYTGTAD